MCSPFQLSHNLLRYLALLIFSLSSQQLFALTEAELASAAETFEKFTQEYAGLVERHCEHLDGLYVKIYKEIRKSMPLFSVIKHILGLEVYNVEPVREKFKREIEIRSKELHDEISHVTNDILVKIKGIAQAVNASDLSDERKKEILSNFSLEKIKKKFNTDVPQALSQPLSDHKLRLWLLGFDPLVDIAQKDFLSDRQRILTHKLIPGLMICAGVTAHAVLF